MGHVLVDEYTFDEGGVCKGTTDFAIYFDKIERDIAPFKIRYLQYGIYGNLCKLLVFFRDAGKIVSALYLQEKRIHLHLAAKAGHRGFQKISCVVLGKFNPI